MKSTRTLWRTIGATSLVTTLLLAGGLVYAVNDIVNPKPAEYNGVAEPKPTEEAKSTIDIVALGDSLTVGTGDISGKGYVQNVREKLALATNKQVNVIGNYAVNGYRTDQLLADLQNASGIPYGIEKADVVLLTIGGNDLFIAAHAVAADCVLVTDNIREFSRVSELSWENWQRQVR